MLMTGENIQSTRLARLIWIPRKTPIYIFLGAKGQYQDYVRPTSAQVQKETKDWFTGRTFLCDSQDGRGRHKEDLEFQWTDPFCGSFWKFVLFYFTVCTWTRRKGWYASLLEELLIALTLASQCHCCLEKNGDRACVLSWSGRSTLTDGPPDLDSDFVVISLECHAITVGQSFDPAIC